MDNIIKKDNLFNDYNLLNMLFEKFCNNKIFIRGIFENMRIAIFVWKEDGVIIQLNRYAFNLFCHNCNFREENLNINLFLSLDRIAIIKEKLLKKNSRAFQYEYREVLTDTNMGELCFDWNNYAVFDEEKTKYIITVGVDAGGIESEGRWEDTEGSFKEPSPWQEELAAINEELKFHVQELKKQREQLRKSEERYRLVVEGASNGIWDWDFINNTAFLSRDWSRRLGFREQEIYGYYEKWADLIHPNDKKGVLSNFKRCLSGKGGNYSYEYRIRLKEGRYIWILSQGKILFNKEKEPIRIAGSHMDITERKKTESRLKYLAYYDNLTGIPIRTTLMCSFKEAIAKAKTKGSKIAVLFLDIDNFKSVNDLYGHHIGDRLLKRVADKLKACVKNSDMLCRIGGDEFVLLLEDLREPEEAEIMAEELLNAFTYPLNISNQRIYVTLSIGVSVYPENGCDRKKLLKKADIAMYMAKESGKNKVQFYNPKMNNGIKPQDDLKQCLRTALVNNEFFLCYQPMLDAATEEIVSLEALIRWRRNGNEIIGPDIFIPVAEETHLIIPIGEWVLETACRQLKKWHEAGFANCSISVNVSVYQLKQVGFSEIVSHILKENKLHTKFLEIEITESMYLEHMNTVTENMKKLREMGVKISLDDFGTGYNTLKNIQNFHMDSLKIDRSFVSNIKIDINKVIVEAILLLGRKIQAKITAEGVETKEQFDYLKSIGCNTIQGYYFSMPLAAEEATRYLTLNKKADNN